MEPVHSFGYWVRRQRKALDLTQAALAHKVGCAPITIRKIEADERRPSRQMARRLAEALLVPETLHESFIASARGLQPVDRLPLAQAPVRAGAVAEAPVDPAPEATTAPEPAVFVGRRRELQALDERLALALAGRGQLAFISGETGRGKSALMAAFARRAQEKTPALLVANGNCNAFAGSGDPYLPFRQILSQLCGNVAGHEALDDRQRRRLLAAAPDTVNLLLNSAPALVDVLLSRDTLRGLSPAAADALDGVKAGQTVEQAQVFEETTLVLRRVAAQRPLLIVLDDLQWSDVASLNLLFHLGRNIDQSRVLLLGAYRPSEAHERAGMSPTPSAPGASLDSVLHELQRSPGHVTLDLEKGEPGHERAFVDALIDANPNRLDEAFRENLAQRTAGHPLFTLELLQEMQQRGDLIQDEAGRWMQQGQLQWDLLPARVEAVIEQRLSRLDETLRSLLAAASVEGETFTAQVLARVQQLAERETLQRLSRELQQRHGLVREQGEINGREQPLTLYRFKHVLFQQYLYHSQSQGERRLLHGEIAARLEELYEDKSAIAVHLARHYAAARQPRQAARYLLQAGDRARALYAHEEAIEQYQQALVFLREVGSRESVARTLMKLALTYHTAFDFERAQQAYREAFTQWQQVKSGPASSSPAATETVRLVWQTPDTLDPSMGGASFTAPIVAELFSGLVTQTPELEVAPDVARSWDVLDGGRTYIFHLRDDVFWSDGAPVTAHDFEFTFKRALDPATKTPAAGLLLHDVRGAKEFHRGRIKDAGHVGVTARDAHTLVVELEAPASYFLELLTYYVFLPVPRHVVQKHGAAWTEPAHFVSNGPFELAGYEPGRRMVLAHNPAYHGRFEGNVKRIDVQLDVETEKQIVLYENDELDVIHDWFFPAAAIDPLRRKWPEQYAARPIFVTLYLCFNVAEPPFDDVRLRRALAMALDQEALAAAVSAGYERPATAGFIPPQMPGHAAESGLPFDPQAARRLLSAAGYPAGRDLPPVFCVARPARRPLLQEVQAQWRRHLQIEVPLKEVSPADYMRTITEEQPPLFAGGWWADYNDPDNFLRVCVEMDLPQWRHEQYQALLAQARHTMAQEERLALYGQVDALLMQEAVLIPLVYSEQHLMLKPWVRRFPTAPVKHPGFWKDALIRR